MQLPNLLHSNFLTSNISVGLDIGNFSVKVAQVKQKRFPKEQYLSFGIRQIGKENSRERVLEAIKGACQDAKIESNKVNLSVCGPEIIMRYITLPCLEFNELSKCLEFELERYIPGKKKESIIIDYKILYRLLNNQMVVLLVALERQIVEERLGLIKEAGLSANTVNVDSLALMDAYNAAGLHAKDKDVTAILDIGHSVTKLVVFQGPTLFFSRDINSGVYDLIRIACERMNVDFASVSESGSVLQEKSKDFYAAIKANLNSLVDELRLSFEYCFRHLQKKVGQLYLSGGGSKLKVIEELIASNLSLKISGLDAARGFRLAPFIKRQELEEFSQLLTVAIGLAAG